MDEQGIENLINHLWPNGGGSKEPTVYAVLDGARDPRILSMLESSDMHYKCLFAGDLSEELRAAAPHIVKLTPKAAFTRQLIEEGWGKSWGIYVIASRPAVLEDVRKNMRKHLRVKDEEGRKMLFRFYDPRVFRVFAPTCTAEQSDAFFGRVIEFVSESDLPGQGWSFKQGAKGIESSKINFQTIH